MNLLDHPDEIEAPNIHVWNNAAFDNGDSEFTTLSFSNQSSKENLRPESLNRSNGAIENSQGKPLKSIEEERNIDAEIEETEREISKLTARLNSLRIEKAARTAIQRGERFIPIKSIEPKLSIKNSDGVKMFESKIGQNRKGLSLGPFEIHAGGSGIHRIQSRRQSCLPKIVDMNDEKAKNRRGSSMSLSPKSRRTLIKAEALRQSATTVVSKRPMKKDGVLELIEPKKLFKDIEKLAPPASVKNQFKTGRVVASRYNQTKESSNLAIENRRSSLELRRNKTPQSTARKRWEIPSEILVIQQEMEVGTGRMGS